MKDLIREESILSRELVIIVFLDFSALYCFKSRIIRFKCSFSIYFNSMAKKKNLQKAKIDEVGVEWINSIMNLV